VRKGGWAGRCAIAAAQGRSRPLVFGGGGLGSSGCAAALSAAPDLGSRCLCPEPWLAVLHGPEGTGGLNPRPAGPARCAGAPGKAKVRRRAARWGFASPQPWRGCGPPSPWLAGGAREEALQGGCTE